MTSTIFDPDCHAPLISLPETNLQHLLVIDLYQILAYADAIEGIDRCTVQELAESLFLFRHHACQIDKRLYLFEGDEPTFSGYELLAEHLFHERHIEPLIQANSRDVSIASFKRLLEHLEILLIDENFFRQLLGDPDEHHLHCQWYTSEHLLVFIYR